jgi:hypothetical protein
LLFWSFMSYHSVYLAVRDNGCWKILRGTRSISSLYLAYIASSYAKGLCDNELISITKWQLHVQLTSPISRQAPWSRALDSSSCSGQCPSTCTYWPGSSFEIPSVTMLHCICRLSLQPFQNVLISSLTTTKIRFSNWRIIRQRCSPMPVGHISRVEGFCLHVNDGVFPFFVVWTPSLCMPVRLSRY